MYGLHILKCPTGKYTFVGSIPVNLMLWRKATPADVTGQRAFYGIDGITLVAYITPIFDDAISACAYANGLGHVAQLSGE
jgi:hypothetical protein